MGQELYKALLEYSRGDDYPFHMPGHKRQFHLIEDPYAVDITEIDGFDNLHHAEGILQEAQERAARLYGSEETHYLVNGSTAGLLAAVAASVRRGGRILVARNCHKAVYHAVLLQGLHASWLYPDIDLQRGIYGSIRPEQMEQAFLDAERSGGEISAVVLTSPTFDGVVSDIRGIAQVVHAHGAVLIVDEAHGAHFAMHSYFPEHAVACGADLVINSVHKTLPAMTQTALIHANGTRVDRIRLRRYLDMFQSSSPSYVLMAGIDRCICLMTEKRQELYDTFICHLEQLRRRLSQMRSLHLITGEETEFPCFDYDRSRLVISTEQSGISGQELYRMLRETYHLQPEMAAEHYVILITTVADTQEGLERLGDALEEIDAQLSKCQTSDTRLYASDAGRQKMSDTGLQTSGIRQWTAGTVQNEEAMSMEAASDSETYEAELSQSEGGISAEYIYLYPPGIPLLIPGERISGQLLDQLENYRKQGLSLQGLSDYTGENIRLVKENQMRYRQQPE
jgi:arginine/lysine/ornithine decarboxylase